MLNNTLKQTLAFYKKNLVAILAIQIPMGFLVVIQGILEPYIENHSVLALIFLLPLFALGSSWGTALTYLLILSDSNATLKKRLSHSASLLVSKLKTLSLASLLIAVFFGLGLYAYVLPGILFIALYFFVPILVVSEPEQPIVRYFYQSKQLVTGSYKLFFLTFAIALLTFLIEIPISYLVELLSERLGYSILLDVGISMLVTGLVDVFICYYFLSLKSKGNP